MKIRLPTILLALLLLTTPAHAQIQRDDDKVDIINRKQLKLAQSALAQLKK